MSEKFKQERAANLTKPGEEPVDSDFERGEPEQRQGMTPKTDGAFKDERGPNLTKPGEQPIDPDELDGEKEADRIGSTASSDPGQSKIEVFSGSTYRV
jgi:hypothetical protein